MIDEFDLEDLPGEVWVDIPGYEGFYQVSNKDRVRSLKRYKKCSRNDTMVAVQPRIMKPTIVYMLCKEGSTKIVTLKSILKKIKELK